MGNKLSEILKNSMDAKYKTFCTKYKKAIIAEAKEQLIKYNKYNKDVYGDGTRLMKTINSETEQESYHILIWEFFVRILKEQGLTVVRYYKLGGVGSPCNGFKVKI